MRKPKQTTAQLAKKYRCHPRTIRAWRRAGAPLDDPKAMRLWLANRKSIPPRLAPSPAHCEPTKGDNTPQELGAGAALNRLEKAEAAAYSRLQASLEGGDPLAIKQHRENWLRLCEQLRHFERAVSEDKRLRGLLVSRPEVEQALERLGYLMRMASEEVCTELAKQLAAEPDFIRSRILIRKCNYDIAILSYAALAAMGGQRWTVDALSRDLTNETTTTREALDRLATFMREALGQRVAERLAAEPSQPQDAGGSKVAKPPPPPAA